MRAGNHSCHKTPVGCDGWLSRRTHGRGPFLGMTSKEVLKSLKGMYEYQS